jgi:hypothetical protein
MMMNNNQTTQEAFSVIREMAALATTPGVSAENVEKANDVIGKLIDKVIKPAVTKLTATNAGLQV